MIQDLGSFLLDINSSRPSNGPGVLEAAVGYDAEFWIDDDEI